MIADGIFPAASIFNNPWIISRIPLWLSPCGGISSTAAAPLDQMPIRADHQVVACHSALGSLGPGWRERVLVELLGNQTCPFVSFHRC